VLVKKSERLLQTKQYALVDLAQLVAFDQSFKRSSLLRHLPKAVIFEGTFAKGAIELSPILFEISTDSIEATKQLIALDNLCLNQSVLSILQSTLHLEALTKHLQDLLLISADGTDYLLRYADTQILAGVNQVLNPSQRSVFFQGIHAWYVTDYQGQLDNMLNQQRYPQLGNLNDLPLSFDVAQTNALLAALAVPMLTAQLRELEPSFAQNLSNIQQIAFVSESLAIAKEDWIEEEVMTSWILERWKIRANKELV
jgi:hypothetical protein